MAGASQPPRRSPYLVSIYITPTFNFSDRVKMAQRSKEAFLFSVQRLWAETGEMYLWTFTFREVPESDDWALDQWVAACKKGARDFRGIHGLRVIELHKLHGIHFHLLLNKRFPIERMLRIFWPFGFGRIGVVKCGSCGAGNYLAKYLAKQHRDKCFLGRRRRWGAFGGFRNCRCSDVEFGGVFSENKWIFAGARFGSQSQRARAYWALMGASMFGHVGEWPNSVKQTFYDAIMSGVKQGCSLTTGAVWWEDWGRRIPGFEMRRAFPSGENERMQGEKMVYAEGPF